jgi:hypothetical protein
MGKATEKMREFAEKIAEALHIDEPDYNDFGEVSEFIDEYKDEFYNSREGRD